MKRRQGARVPSWKQKEVIPLPFGERLPLSPDPAKPPIPGRPRAPLGPPVRIATLPALGGAAHQQGSALLCHINDGVVGLARSVGQRCLDILCRKVRIVFQNLYLACPAR